MHRFTEEEEELRYWLANEDWYLSKYTKQWLARKPRVEAVEMLAGIAREAEPEPHSPWSTFVAGFASAGFLPTAGATMNARKAGVRAALLLASLGDSRCIAPLMRVFETDARYQNKYQESIETALKTYLDESDAQWEAREHLAEIRALAERIWQSGGARREISPPITNLLSAALRFIHRVGNDQEWEVIRSVAAADAPTPNRRWARKKAELLLDTGAR